jgi:hypothetical protein
MPRKILWEEPLRIAAKSGFLTKELFQEYMFEGKTQRGVNWSWAKLKDSREFKIHPNPRIHGVLVLNRHSKIVQSRTLGCAATTPHEAVLRHDEILLRGVLGIEKRRYLQSWVLEPELKMNGLEAFEISSQGNRIKFPDALLSFNNGALNNIAALELELTQKDGKRYDQILSAYSSMKGVGLILFIAGSSAIEKAIERHARESFYPIHGQKLAFMSLDEWQRNPLVASMRSKDRSQTLESWITGSNFLQV